MSGLPSSRSLAAAVAVSAALLLAACGGSTTPSASGSASAPAPASSAAPASPTAEQTPNGVESKSAKDILAEAQKAAKAQSSVQVTATSEGEDGFDFDLSISREAGGYGTITSAGNTIQIVVTKDTIYLKADPAFWAENVGQEAADMIGDKWVTEPAGEGAFSDVASLADLDQVIDGLLSPSGEVTKGEVGEADGMPAVALESSDGTLWVATTGEPLPLLIEQKDGAGRASFTNWSAPVEIPVPGPDQVIAESDLPMPSLAPSASSS